MVVYHKLIKTIFEKCRIIKIFNNRYITNSSSSGRIIWGGESQLSRILNNC
jgi:hypothetical protein